MKRYLPQGITREERTAFLNARMRGVRPGVCVERARLVTESYRQTEGEPYIIRRAKGLAHILQHMTIFIDREELIVGNHASHPRWAPLYPETNRLSARELDLFPVREVDTLQITEEDKRTLLEEIYPYWEGRCTEDICRHYIPADGEEQGVRPHEPDQERLWPLYPEQRPDHREGLCPCGCPGGGGPAPAVRERGGIRGQDSLLPGGAHRLRGGAVLCRAV